MRTFPKTILSLLGFGLIVFVLLELTARVALFGFAGLDPRRVDSVRNFRETQFIRVSDDPTIGFELAPNVDGWFKLVPFRTNSLGLRDREYSLKKPPGTFRAVVMGASFALPAGVAIEDAFHSLMEDRLSSERAPRVYEFINFAVGASNPRQALAMLARRAIHYEPDLILFCTTRLSLPILPGPLLATRNESSLRLLPATHPLFKSFLIEFANLRLNPESAEVPFSGIREEDPERSVLAALGDFRRRHRIPIVVVFLEYEATRRLEGELEIARAIRKQDLHFFDTRPHFEGVRAHDLWIYDLDPHPNEQAHEIFADALTEYLLENSLLDQREP